MSTAPTTNDDTFPDPVNWEAEAHAIIRDVQRHVAEISISARVPSSRTHIFLNVTTLEQTRICVRVSGEGFRVVGEDHDQVAPEDELQTADTFDTPYALLGQVSPAYTNSFGNSLSEALQKLADS